MCIKIFSAKKIIRTRLNTKNSTEDPLRKKSFDCNIEIQEGKNKDLQNSVYIIKWNNTK